MKTDGMDYVKRYALGAVAALLVLPVAPTVAVAQDGDCVEEGNRITRGADVELAYAGRRDDTRSEEYRYSQALEKVQENIAEGEALPRSYLLAAKSYLGLRDHAGADSMLTKLVAEAPSCEEQAQRLRFNAWVPLYNAGIEAMRAGDVETALERFQGANLINKDARSLAYAGSIQQQQGNNERAAELYEMALETGGEQDEIVRTASINLATIRQQAGDTEGALEIYEEYSNENPDDILGRLNFAIALMDAERQDEAQAIFNELMERDDLTFNQWSQVGIGLYRAQNFERAAEAFQRAYEANSHNKETLENLANSYYQAESYEDLLPLAAEMVERYPLERVPYNLLANSHRDLGNPDSALAVLEKRDALPVEFLRTQLTPTGQTTYSIDGQVMNRTAPAGSTLSIPFTLVGDDGSAVITDTLELTVPAEGETAAFSLQLESDAPVAGFKYEAPAS